MKICFKLEVKQNLPQLNFFITLKRKPCKAKRGVLWVGVLWFLGLDMAGAYPQPCTKIMRQSSPPPKINAVVLKVGMAALNNFEIWGGGSVGCYCSIGPPYFYFGSTVAAFHYQPAITSTCGPRRMNIQIGGVRYCNSAVLWLIRALCIA